MGSDQIPYTYCDLHTIPTPTEHVFCALPIGRRAWLHAWTGPGRGLCGRGLPTAGAQFQEVSEFGGPIRRWVVRGILFKE